LGSDKIKLPRIKKEDKRMRLHRTCWLEINLDNIKSNFRAIQEMVGGKVTIMPAVKANAYGHGVIMACKALDEAGAKVIAVGSIDEAMELRKAGLTTKIVVFASNLISDVADLYVENDITPTILYKEQAEAISKATVKEHGIFVKIETGRGRLGINAEECADVIKEIAGLPNIRVDGIYSHMAYANWEDEKISYPMWQFERFKKALDQLEAYGIHIPFAQLVNTPGGIAYPDIRLTGMCPGRGIWGFSPLEKREEHPDLKPAMVAWKSRLIQVKEVIGGKLGPDFAAVRLDIPKRIGLLAGGVSDGIVKSQAQGGVVLVNGKRVPVCSPMSLEHTTVDLTSCPDAKLGDEVVIMGKQGDEEITREELLRQWNIAIPYFWTAIPEHVERVYYENGEPVAIARGYSIEKL